MDKNNRSNETLLDFSSIFWGFVDQWKAVLIFALVFSLIITGFKFRGDSTAYDAAVSSAKESFITSEQAEKETEGILGTLSGEDRAIVDYALGFHSLISDKYKYQSESPLMSIDPNHTEVLTITYRIAGDIEPSLLSSLNNGYITVFNDHAALKSISEATSAKIAPHYIKELISFSDPYSASSQATSIIQNDNSFNIFVIIPQNESPNLFESAITDVIKKRCSELSSSIVPHSIETVSSSTSTAVCNGIQAKQSDVYYTISYLKVSLDSIVSGLSDPQSAAYNSVIQLQGRTDNNEGISHGAETTDLVKPGISKKFLIAGFILGVLLYFFVYTIYLVLSEKIVSSKIVKRITNKRILGEYYNFIAESSILGKLLHSPAIFNLRHRGMTDLEKQASAVSQSLDVISSRENISNITLINSYSEQDPFIDSIKKACISEDGISLNALQQTDINDEAFKDVSNAVISVSNNTRINELYSIIDLLDYYHINVLGFVYTASH